MKPNTRSEPRFVPASQRKEQTLWVADDELYPTLGVAKDVH
jgi:hypothetical protein